MRSCLPQLNDLWAWRRVWLVSPPRDGDRPRKKPRCAERAAMPLELLLKQKGDEREKPLRKHP